MRKVNLISLRLELAVKARELPKIDGDYWIFQRKSNPKPQASTDRHRYTEGEISALSQSRSHLQKWDRVSPTFYLLLQGVQNSPMSTTTAKTKTVKADRTSSRPYSSTDTVRTYLHEIGRVPLLTREEEIVFGKQVQQMMKLIEAKQAFAKEWQRDLTNQEWAAEMELTEAELNRILQVGRRAKKKMIEANLRLVVAIAKKYQKRNMEFLDLIQEGTLGLERGVEKFDPMRGYKFSTYAYWWIRQAITRAIAQHARTIRLPIHITEKLNKIKKVQRELTQQFGRSPSPAEIATALELQPSQIREYLLMARHPVSLDLRVGDNQDTELQELLEDETASPDNYITSELLRQDLNTLISELTPQQRDVIVLRFGLEDGTEMSLAKVGERLNLSRERVRQLEHQALAHLRRRQSQVREYLAS